MAWCACGGAKPGEDNRNEKRWQAVAPGDLLLFVHGRTRITAARVLEKLRNERQSRAIWGETATKNQARQTWELMMVLDAPFDSSLSVESLNDVIGRKRNANVQEFVVKDEVTSARLLEAMGVAESTAARALINSNDFEDSREPSGDLSTLDVLDAAVSTKRRLEQAALRRRLLPDATADCALCGRTFPVEYLVAAHIKPRAKCSDSEKRDLANVVMANCLFGCDELWGRGHVSIGRDGRVVWSSEAPDAGAVRSYLGAFLPEGKVLRHWEAKPGSRPYFLFHLEQEFKA